MRLGVTLSPLIQNSKVEGHIRSALKAAQKDYTLCFIPFYDGKISDSKMHSDYLGDFYDTKDLGWSATAAEHLAKIQSVDALITMRFHGTIFATMTGTPFLSLSSKGKDSLFCEQEDFHPYHLELNGLNSYRILDRLERFKTEGSKLRERLKRAANLNRGQVEWTFGEIRKRFLAGK
jgi:polysaccharide pyruvyl transferase WcaK-like protein